MKYNKIDDSYRFWQGVGGWGGVMNVSVGIYAWREEGMCICVVARG